MKTISVTIDKLAWPVSNVLAIQTSRLPSATTLDNIRRLSSDACYDDFNLALHVGDIDGHVTSNRQQLLKQLATNTNIQWLEQVHGSDVVTLLKHSSRAIKADAQITRRQNLALAIMTADCLPILLANKAGSEIAAIHAGWRSLAANIIAKTLADMVSENGQLVAWLGPCIGAAHFEVGPEVKSAFTQIDRQLAVYFVQNSAGRFQADLAGIASYFLAQSGVNHIVHSNECTFSLPNKYYSYRRQNKTGRMASVIVLQ